jgi:ATP-dependent Clp protease ATP-binding subunit ClpC
VSSLRYSSFDDFTRARRLGPARRFAATKGHGEVDIQHLLLVDLDSPDSLLRQFWEDARSDGGAKFEAFREALERSLPNPAPEPLDAEQVRFSEAVVTIASALSEGSATPESHLARAIAMRASVPDRSAPIGWKVLLAGVLDYRPHRVVPLLLDFGLSSETIFDGLEPAAVAAAGALDTAAQGTIDALSAFTYDLTAEARRGQLEDAIGRDAEIERMMTILCQRETNNPLLLGDAGVGKTKLVEGLAVRIVDGRVHPKLAGKRLLSLDVGLLVAGTQYRGQFEDRLKSMLRALKDAKGSVLMFIDEVHQLLGLGQTSGAMDAANLLKPALARGELRCIGATTYEEYRHIERDPALRRRFQAVDVPEPDAADVANIVARAAKGLERFHSVKFTEESLVAVVTMGRRYIGDVRSPAREIGLMDELGATVSRAAAAPARKPQQAHVLRDHVQEVISRRTRIPVEKMTVGQQQRLLSLETLLATRVFGQTDVIRSAAKSIRRGMIGLSHPNRPRAVFFFAGPSGVGKTELAKAMADHLYDGPDSMVRFDMSEFSSETARNRLIGSDPGYVGSEEGGVLTNAVRRRPFSLVLLDEFEKAHPNVWRLFLQVVDEGRLTDGKQRTVRFNETVIVFTSNVGAGLLAELREVERRFTSRAKDVKDAAARRELLHQTCEDATSSSLNLGLLRAAASYLTEPEGPDAQASYSQLVKNAILTLPNFPPELLSRIGSPLVFSPLSDADLLNVLDSLIVDLVKRVAAIRGLVPSAEFLQGARIELTDDDDNGRRCQMGNFEDSAARLEIRLDPASMILLMTRGRDPVLGARALRTIFEVEVEGEIADRLLRIGEGHADICLELGVVGNKIFAKNG